MAATVAFFSMIPPTRVDGGEVRFVPYVQNNLTPIVGYTWDFGDGATSATPAAIHSYAGASPYTFTASLVVTDAAGNSTGATTNTFCVDTAANVPDEDNTVINAVSVCIYDTANSMVVNRSPWGNGTTYGCNFYLLNPRITNSIDKIGVAKFSILTTGASVASAYMSAQAGLLKEGANVLIIVGKEIVFSGIIRRVEQDKQAGFSSTSQVQIFDIECDSDLARLKKESVSTSALPTTGDIIIDSPANIFRRIMT